MNQWIGSIAAAELLDVYRPQTWRRFALTGPLSAVTIVAMLFCSRMLKPTLPTPPAHNAIEAQLVEVIPPQPAGLQGGAAPAPLKPKIVPQPQPAKHANAVAARHPKIVAPPIISPCETSAVGAGPSGPSA